jgi:hypothetical protein
LILLDYTPHAFTIWRFEEFLGLNFYYHIRNVEDKARTDEASGIQFPSNLKYATIFPSLINLTHIYAYYQLELPMKQALEAGTMLLVCEDKVSAISIGLKKRNYPIISVIL